MFWPCSYPTWRRSAENLILGVVTLAACLLWNIFAKGYLKQLSVLFGLAVGYVLAICLGRVDLSVIMSGGLISLPKILLSGVQMIAQAGFTQRNITIASLALAFGIGFTSASEAGIWGIFPEIIQTVFGANVVAVVFVVAVFLNLVLPKNMDVKKKDISDKNE